ncbi:MAG TPA: DUF1501 domain-containing protein [Tepidisphaeraceae bacterium]|nr:DUF1501 domain-containing protein [Tepidisphaeraceae bacterium]
MNDTPRIDRRQFLRRAACAAVGATAVTSTVADLRMINAVSAATNPADYKALVCLFLFGGNDGNNLVVPTDSTSYGQYAAARGGLALGTGQLAAINPAVSDGHSYGMHPACPEIAQLFNSGKAALVFNVGSLVVPTTKTQFQAQSVPLPAQLFAHSEQQVQWQTSIPDRLGRSGWGGRAADLLNSMNGSASVSMNISINTSNVFQVGNQVTPYTVSQNGSVGLPWTTGTRLQAVKDLLDQPHPNLYEDTYAKTTRRAIDNDALLSGALGAAAPFTTPFPSGGLAAQLKMIARLIAARGTLGHSRQIFFASVGGYDLHGTQAGAHHDLLRELSTSLKAFYDCTVELGVASQVTTFTASDFGRTLQTNGTGSEHGWGNHQIVMGGAVRGQRTYGVFPNMAINGPDDTGQGRWIPTISVDEYSATMAKWFGVSPTNMPIVFPNIARFRQDLGFML